MFVIRAVNKLEDVLIRLVSILILLIGLYALYDTHHILDSAQNKSAWVYKPRITEDNTVVYPDHLEGMVAWLTIDDTNIDYPVMQAENNIEWLNKDPLGNYSLAGSIFLDMSNAPDFSDPYSLVYGHHVEGELMFGTLDKFSDKTYFNTHRTGTLTAGEHVYRLHTFAYLKADATNYEIFAPAEDRDPLGYVKDNAPIYEEPENKHIVALTTCVNASTFERTIVMAWLEELT